eukprot:PhF_6_TR33614/c0_g1_i2/m.49090
MRPVYIIALIVFAGVVYLVTSIYPSIQDDQIHPTPTQAGTKQQGVQLPPPIQSDVSTKRPSPPISTPRTDAQKIVTWGYSPERNVQRWNVIKPHLIEQFSNAINTAHTVLDYGADQGFFSVMSAVLFPNASVFAVEKGSVGGSIWKSAQSMKDVLETAKERAKSFGVASRFFTCRTNIHPKMWGRALHEEVMYSVVYVLSVLHWFDINGESGFHQHIRTLISTSRVTIIELPHPKARNTFGEKRYRKWFQRESNGTKLLLTTIETMPSCKLYSLGKLPWGTMFREVHSVVCAHQKTTVVPPIDKIKLIHECR